MISATELSLQPHHPLFLTSCQLPEPHSHTPLWLLCCEIKRTENKDKEKDSLSHVPCAGDRSSSAKGLATPLTIHGTPGLSWDFLALPAQHSRLVSYKWETPAGQPTAPVTEKLAREPVRDGKSCIFLTRPVFLSL